MSLVVFAAVVCGHVGQATEWQVWVLIPAFKATRMEVVCAKLACMCPADMLRSTIIPCIHKFWKPGFAKYLLEARIVRWKAGTEPLLPLQEAMHVGSQYVDTFCFCSDSQ